MDAGATVGSASTQGDSCRRTSADPRQWEGVQGCLPTIYSVTGVPASAVSVFRSVVGSGVPAKTLAT